MALAKRSLSPLLHRSTTYISTSSRHHPITAGITDWTQLIGIPIFWWGRKKREKEIESKQTKPRPTPTYTQLQNTLNTSLDATMCSLYRSTNLLSSKYNSTYNHYCSSNWQQKWVHPKWTQKWCFCNFSRVNILRSLQRKQRQVWVNECEYS